MIIWINGGFGSGKTQTAYELQKRVENSFVFDPENTGFYIRSNLPKAISKSDFQDYTLWRTFNAEMLEYLDKHYKGVIICPMTVTDKDYLNQMIGSLDENVEYYHFTLMTTKETLYKRLRGRGEKKNSWAIDQIERCVEKLSDEAFRNHIHTDEMTIDEVVNYICEKCNLKMKTEDRSKIRKKLDRIIVWKKHFR